MIQSSHPPSTARRAFTLIELLVAISLIATVAGMFLVAYRSAATEASNVRTSSTIRKISDVLTARMQEYESFRLEPQAIDASVAPSAATGFRFRTTQIPGNATPLPNPNQEGLTILRERARLMSLRQTIVQELPEHPDDLKWTTTWYAGGNVEQHLQNWLCNAHALPTGLFAPGRGTMFSVIDLSQRTRSIIRRLSVVDPMTGAISPIPGWELRNANAELLYLIIEDSSYNGSSALELFGKSEIRDTDGDGLREFVDAFGNPIRWIRWPSASGIGLRTHPDLLDPALAGMDVHGDPMDRSKSDPGYAPYSTFRDLIGLRPLVVSPGVDRRFGIRMQLDDPISIGPPLFPAATQSFSLGDVPLGVAPQVDLPYSSDPVDAYVADPWYPRGVFDANGEPLGLGFFRTRTARPPFNPNFPLLDSDYYDVAQESLDNVSNLETGGGAL